MGNVDSLKRDKSLICYPKWNLKFNYFTKYARTKRENKNKDIERNYIKLLTKSAKQAHNVSNKKV